MELYLLMDKQELVRIGFWFSNKSIVCLLGKTFTMEGKKDDNKNYGIIPNSFAHVFLEISKASQNVG